MPASSPPSFLAPTHTHHMDRKQPSSKMKIPPNPLKVFSTLTYSICSIYRNCCYCSSKFIQQILEVPTMCLPSFTKDIAVNKITPSPHRAYILLAHTFPMAQEKKSQKSKLSRQIVPKVLKKLSHPRKILKPNNT